MSDLNRIEQNNAELRECIEIAESLPDAPEKVNGYDIATMQKFVDSKGSFYYFYYDAEALTDASWLGSVDTSKIKNMSMMFYYCENLEKVPLFDTSNVTNMSNTFDHCSKLKEVPLFDTSNVTTMHYAFYSSGLKEVPPFNISKVVYMDEAFYQTSLKEFPALDFSSCTTVYGMCERISSLVTLPEFYLPKVTTMGNMFKWCYALTTVPKIIAPLCTNVSQMFQGDSKLTTIVEIDIRSVTGASSMLSGCSALTDLTLKNIKTNLTVGSGTSWGHLLTVDSLVGLCYELRDTGSLKTLTIGSANLEKLASVYVRQITITDAMRAEDDLIDEKLPFERCESTDEGATLIGDYVLLKNWKLA